VCPTTYCQIVADEIGLRYEDVKIEFIDYFYFDAIFPAGSMGSTLNTFGLAVNSRKMKRLLLEYALKPLSGSISSPFHGKTIDDLDIRESLIFEKANPGNSMPVRRVTSSQAGGLRPRAEGGFSLSATHSELPEVKERFVMARQCVFVEVEVDTETGQVEVTKLVHPYDVGQSINPDVMNSNFTAGICRPGGLWY